MIPSLYKFAVRIFLEHGSLLFYFFKRTPEKSCKGTQKLRVKRKQIFPSLYKFAARMFLEQDSLLFLFIFFQNDFREKL